MPTRSEIMDEIEAGRFESETIQIDIDKLRAEIVIQWKMIDQYKSHIALLEYDVERLLHHKDIFRNYIRKLLNEREEMRREIVALREGG